MNSEKKNKYFKATIKSFNEATNTAEVTVSDESIDRYKEIVRVDSFKNTLKDFMKHPVLLSSHNYRGLLNQIGIFKSLKVNKEKKEVIGVIEYFAKAGNPEADYAMFLASKGIAAFSIGFIPKKYRNFVDEEIDASEGAEREYTEIELLEISQVLIPANPAALQKSFGEENEDEPIFRELAEKLYNLYEEGKVKEAMDTAEVELQKEVVEKEEIPEEKENLELNFTEELTSTANETMPLLLSLIAKIDEMSITIAKLVEAVNSEKEIEDEEIKETAASESESEQEETTPETEQKEIEEVLGIEKIEELRNCLFPVEDNATTNTNEEIKKLFDDTMVELREKFLNS
jgi:HK97 family phage prohead protease